MSYKKNISIQLTKIFDRLKPFIDEMMISESINSYKENYKKVNKGKEPSKNNINNLLQIIIANGQLKNQSESLITETIEEILGVINKRKIKYTIIDSTILIATLTILISYIIIFFKIKSKAKELSIDIFLNWGFSIMSIILGMIYVFYFVIHNISKKE